MANWIERVEYPSIFPSSRDVEGDSQKSSFCTHSHFSSRDVLKEGLMLARRGGSKESAHLIAIYSEQSLFFPRRRERVSCCIPSTFGNDRFSHRPTRFRRRENSKGSTFSLSICRKEDYRPWDELAPETRYKGLRDSLPLALEFSYPNSTWHRADVSAKCRRRPTWTREQTFEENKVTSWNRTCYSPSEGKRPFTLVHSLGLFVKILTIFPTWIWAPAAE